MDVLLSAESDEATITLASTIVMLLYGEAVEDTPPPQRKTAGYTASRKAAKIVPP